MLIRSIALLGAVAVGGLAWTVPANCAPETDWWRTGGAAVVEYRATQGETACSLFLYTDDRAAIVTWGRSGAKEISFEDRGWQFTTDQPIAVAVRVGDAWLGDPAGDDRLRLVASVRQEQLSVPLGQPVEGLLRSAAKVTVRLPDREMSVDVDRRKMPALLSAVERCRSTLR
jgi:hypothetical protein